MVMMVCHCLLFVELELLFLLLCLALFLEVICVLLVVSIDGFEEADLADLFLTERFETSREFHLLQGLCDVLL